jgi:hypothetical protein
MHTEVSEEILSPAVGKAVLLSVGVNLYMTSQTTL